ncbi:Adenylate kinase 4 [Hibiscus syriacus]|uniref:adenylate kinase n=1 Tax=Hibiscus syriacus TaxID=106335 RepID=A0A6A2WF28_HIBSY|nr:Adenylate kinase 4 [Hibiscus syriacus]
MASSSVNLEEVPSESLTSELLRRTKCASRPEKLLILLRKWIVKGNIVPSPQPTKNKFVLVLEFRAAMTGLLLNLNYTSCLHSLDSGISVSYVGSSLWSVLEIWVLQKMKSQDNIAPCPGPTKQISPPGSGKGTRSPVIKDEYCLCHLATGDMLRVAVFTKTPLGIKAKEAMDKGELVSDDLVVGIIDEAMKKPSRALSRIFMLALSLDEMLERQRVKIDKVTGELLIQCKDDTAVFSSRDSMHFTANCVEIRIDYHTNFKVILLISDKFFPNASALNSASAILLETTDCFLLLQVVRFPQTKVQ